MISEQIYTLNFRLVFRFFYYKGVPKDEVEDLVHDTFLRFAQHYEPDHLDDISIRKILYGISRNVWREWVRLQVQQNVFSLDELPDIGELDQGFFLEQDEDILASISDQQLNDALAKLSERHRSVLVMRFMNGWDRRSVAEELSISEKDVHTYQKRALRMLRQILESTVPPNT
jgi:RNA polymerase sigma factor (sigma-70 family)